MTQSRESRPQGWNPRAAEISAGDTHILPENTDNSLFAALTERELLEAIHPDVVAAEQRGYDAGFRDGFARGALFAKGECLADHATVANRIDAAARAFYLLDADDAHRKAVGE